MQINCFIKKRLIRLLIFDGRLYIVLQLSHISVLIDLKKLIFAAFAFFAANFPLHSQSIDVPGLALSGIPFEISISGLSSEINSLDISLASAGINERYHVNIENGTVDTSFVISESGTYRLLVSGMPELSSEIRPIPALTSIVPPLLEILLALIIRQVIVALAAGIYMGAFFIYDYNPFTALVRLAETFIFQSVADSDDIYIIQFTLMLGGVVGIISDKGGKIGLDKRVTDI